MKTMILAILVLTLGLFLPACVEDSSATSPDAGSELSPLLGTWDVEFFRTPCYEEGEGALWRVQFKLLPHDDLVMVSEQYPWGKTRTAGAILDGDTGRVRFEEDSSGDVYDVEIAEVEYTASAVVHYEHRGCAVDTDPTSVKHSRF
jgi:hypothetical protein